MNTSLLFFILLFGFPEDSGRLRVYEVTGEVYFQVNENERQVLPVEKELSMGKLIILSGSVILFNESGENIRLSDPGTYTLDEINQRLETEKSLGTSFFKYWWKQLNKKKKTPEEQPMSAAGVVDRANQFRITAPSDSTILTKPEVMLRWSDANSPYAVELSNVEGDVLFSASASSPEITLKFNPALFPGQTIIITVKDASSTYTENVTFYYYP